MKKMFVLIFTAALLLVPLSVVLGCTGITLKSAKNDYLAARTMEWGSSFFDSKLVIIPRGYFNQSKLQNNARGLAWTVKNGFIGIAVGDTAVIAEGMNEKGLSVGVFYFPGYASYQVYGKSSLDKGLNVIDLSSYILSMYSTVNEVKNGIDTLNVLPVPIPQIKGVPPLHWRIFDKTGQCIVIEIINNGKIMVHDAPLGVITNSPTYDWHITNIRNYVNLRSAPADTIKIEDALSIAPFGAGSGMLGIPGDFTPPSRFIRATAFCATAPPAADAYTAMSQCFVILDNFDIPLGSVYAPGKIPNPSLPSSTQWTTVSDVTNLIFYYTTNYNRQIRQLNAGEIDFSTIRFQAIPLDRELHQNIEIISVR